MISSLLALTAATFAVQATDTTRASREAFTRCLRAYVDRSVEARTEIEAFRTQFPQQCAQQESTLRQAIIQRESALRATRANAEQSAREEIEDARQNAQEMFEYAMTPE